MTGNQLDDIVRLDVQRRARRGIAEAIYTEGKSDDQLRSIASTLIETEEPTLFTRASVAQAELLQELLPDGRFHDVARLFAWPATPPKPVGGKVVVACAGSTDVPVAMEAALTTQYLARHTDLITDVGVAGIHRILGQQELLRAADAIIVVAGMDGALPGVVAGLVSAPVIAVPTSVGYGAAFEGLAPLLTMLNACAPGVSVVNIDNGYGAGHIAAQISRPR
jgi:NCAIR mutase (PurE)-related protein